MFRNTTIKKKLLFVIFFMSAMLLAVGAFGLKGMTVIKQNFRGVYHDRLIPTGQLAHINEMMQTNVRQLQLASMHDPRLPESKLHSHPLSLHTEIIEKNIGEISALWQQYMTAYLTPEEKKLADEYVKERMTFVNDGLKPAMVLLKAGKFAEANVHIVTVVGPAYQKAKDIAEKLLQLQLDITKEEYEKSEAEYTLELTVSIVTIFAGIAFSLMMGVFLLRSIGASLAMANRIANNIASGDLTGKVEIHTKDEIGQLLESMRAMQNSLTHIVNQVRSGADTIATASSQIAAGNMDLSSRTEEQASSLEETASSMEELTSTVRQNADNARHANQLAVTASDVAVKGGSVVSQVVTTMGEINESAKKMTDIIGAIDGIAFQTNILALNAAVEAARAGEQGRGFAVVATEVRNLAQRSAAAAREIKTLIDDSVQRISEGGRLAGEAGVTMDDVVSSIKRVTDIMSEITAASREQSDGIEQVNQAVAQMDQVTQQNAALVEESAAAAESMQDQAAHLVQVVGVFRTGTETASLTAPVARTATTRPVTRLPAKPTSAVAVSTANSPAQTSSRQPLPATSKNEDWEEF